METDPLLEEAKKISLEAGSVRISWLQRKLRISYIRAARIMDTLAEQGFCEAEYSNDFQGRRIIAAPNTVLHADKSGLAPTQAEYHKSVLSTPGSEPF